MPTNLDTLRAQPRALIQETFDDLANGGSYGGFRKGMTQAIRRSQTAAYIAATAERLKVSPRAITNLSRVEQKELNARIAAQLTYLDGFVADLRQGKLTMRESNARALLYAGATRGAFYATLYQGLPFYPTEGCECMANCRCRWEQQGKQFYWRMSAAEHCPTCERREAGNPYQVEAA